MYILNREGNSNDEVTELNGVVNTVKIMIPKQTLSNTKSNSGC